MTKIFYSMSWGESIWFFYLHSVLNVNHWDKFFVYKILLSYNVYKKMSGRIIEEYKAFVGIKLQLGYVWHGAWQTFNLGNQSCNEDSLKMSLLGLDRFLLSIARFIAFPLCNTWPSSLRKNFPNENSSETLAYIWPWPHSIISN